MPSKLHAKLNPNPTPLYRDILEFIDVMGIKNNRVWEAFGISRTFWFKLKREHMYGLSLENMHRFALTYNLPPEKVMSLCYMTYIRGLAKAQNGLEGDSSEQPANQSATVPVDADFPPIH